MPRSYYNETEKLKAKFQEFVFGRMKILKLNQRQVADSLLIKQTTFSYKLRTLTFDIGELIDLLNVLEVKPKELSEMFLYEIRRNADV